MQYGMRKTSKRRWTHYATEELQEGSDQRITTNAADCQDGQATKTPGAARQEMTTELAALLHVRERQAGLTARHQGQKQEAGQTVQHRSQLLKHHHQGGNRDLEPADQKDQKGLAVATGTIGFPKQDLPRCLHPILHGQIKDGEDGKRNHVQNHDEDRIQPSHSEHILQRHSLRDHPHRSHLDLFPRTTRQGHPSTSLRLLE